MPATNATTTKTRATTLQQSASSSTTVKQGAATQAQTKAAGQASTQAGTGIFNWQLPNIMPSLDQFLGLPAVIDWQDIGIRVSMVVVGVVLLLLVGWAFLRGKQTTNVQVVNSARAKETAAMEAAEVA